MNNQDLATTLTKLGGIALIVYAVISISSYAPYLVANQESIAPVDVISVFLTKAILPILIGLYFIYFGGLLIRRHIPDIQIESERLEGLEKTALSVLGVYLLYHAISDMVLNLAYLYKVNLMIKEVIPTSLDEQMNADMFSAIVATIVQIVFSLWLILGSNGMVTLFNRLRSR